MSAIKKGMTESSVLLGGLRSLQNKENLNGDEIKQMINLLKAYETLCIQRQDFNGADSVKNKIQQLKEQETHYQKETIATRQKEQIEVICLEGEKQIKEFQSSWDREISSLIDELKSNEEELVRIQQVEIDQFVGKLASQQKPKIKYSSAILEKRKYLANLIKIRNYKEAEIIKNALKQMYIQEEVKWNQKWQQKKKLKIEMFEKKQNNELQVFRVKLQGIFNEKIKERDRKFQILLKKNRKRKVESSKISRQRFFSKNGVLADSKMAQSQINRSFSQKNY